MQLFSKKKNKLKVSAFHALSNSYVVLLLARAFSSILSGILDKKRLRTACVGDQASVFAVMESLYDLGFDCEETMFFENKQNDPLRPFRAFEELCMEEYDVIFLGDQDAKKEKELKRRLLEKASAIQIIELKRLATVSFDIMQEININNYRSCLNPHKLALICAAIYLTPYDGAVFEAGVYLGGTTIVMAKLQKALKITRPIYAFDTFEGMPAAHAKDKSEKVYYDSGMFIDNSQAKVARYYKKEGVSSNICMVAGLLEERMPVVIKKEKKVAFMLLDTDQYASTKAGLEYVLPVIKEGGLIIIDDTTLKGVSAALEEVQKQVKSIKKVSISPIQHRSATNR